MKFFVSKFFYRRISLLRKQVILTHHLDDLFQKPIQLILTCSFVYHKSFKLVAVKKIVK